MLSNTCSRTYALTCRCICPTKLKFMYFIHLKFIITLQIIFVIRMLTSEYFHLLWFLLFPANCNIIVVCLFEGCTDGILITYLFVVMCMWYSFLVFPNNSVMRCTKEFNFFIKGTGCHTHAM